MLKCDGTDNQPRSLIAKAYRQDCFIVNNGEVAVGTPSPSVNPYSALVIKR